MYCGLDAITIEGTEAIIRLNKLELMKMVLVEESEDEEKARWLKKQTLNQPFHRSPTME